MTDAAQEALRILRDGSQFQWYVIPLFALVIYVYAVEIERKNWNLVLAGLAFWGMDWFNEIWNALVFHFTQYAPVWGAPGDTAYLILIGLNIEICFMFAIAGVAFSKMLPADKNMRILGLPNRRGTGDLRRCLLCVRGGSAERRERAHLGLLLVERPCPLADLPDRLLPLLRGVLLGARHEELSGARSPRSA